MSIDEIGKLVSQIGIPAGFAFGLLLLIWQVIKLVGPYARDFCDHHTSLMNTLEETLKEQSVSAAQHLVLLEKLGDQTGNTVVLRKVAVHAVSVIEKIARRLELDVDTEVRAMRQQLMKKDTG